MYADKFISLSCWYADVLLKFPLVLRHVHLSDMSSTTIRQKDESE